MTLLQHIQNLNAEKKAWMEAGPDRWTGMFIEDLDHWAEYGVYTVEDFERYQLEATIWDAYKDAYGVRPRHMDFKSMTTSELEAEADRIFADIEENVRLEEEAAQKAVARFQELVQKTIDLGAEDEVTALRWLTQDEDFYSGQDVEYWVWDRGILYTSYGRDILHRLCEIVEFKEFKVA